jgi:hypothetical protein
MGKKSATLEEVKVALGSRGYTLVSQEYTGVAQKLEVICPSNHEIQLSFHKFQHGKGCAQCAGVKKHTIDYVRQVLDSRGYTLLSEVYVNNKAPLLVRCDKNHTYETLFAYIRVGQRCPECYKVRVKPKKEIKHKNKEVRVHGNTKYNLENLREIALGRGYTLLSETYVGYEAGLEFKCPLEHNVKMRCHDFISGHGCSKCGGTQKHTHAEVKEFYTSKGWTLLSTEYVSFKDHLEIECEAGHKFKTSLAVSKRGFGCPRCSGNNKATPAEVKAHYASEGYSVDETQYVSALLPIQITCKEGHQYTARYSYFKCGNRCPKCMEKTSHAEQEVLAYAQSFYPSALKVHLKDIHPDSPPEINLLELDIYIPELKLGIEYCGLYWHSEANTRGNKKTTRHRRKMEAFNSYGIRVITIFEDEWTHRKEQVKNFLNSVLNKQPTRIFARKCTVAEVDKKVAKEFIATHHIQKVHHFKVAHGLFHEGQLVGVMTGNQHHRKADVFVLQRMCFAGGVLVVGGASKLFQALKRWCIAQEIQKLISWSDNRWSEGNVYTKLGFTLESETICDYSYFRDGETSRISKQSLKKTPKERLTGKTESVLREEQGYLRIWDCGKKAWTYDCNI